MPDNSFKPDLLRYGNGRKEKACHTVAFTTQAGSTQARTAVIHELKKLLANMEPTLNPGTYAFVAAPANLHVQPDQIIASVREPEGLSLVIPESLAQALDLPVSYSAAWITLTVHSDLAAIGLTAAFSAALGQAGISCNVVAGVHHDHLFVPAELAPQAMDVLAQLQASAA